MGTRKQMNKFVKLLKRLQTIPKDTELTGESADGDPVLTSPSFRKKFTFIVQEEDLHDRSDCPICQETKKVQEEKAPHPEDVKAVEELRELTQQMTNAVKYGFEYKKLEQFSKVDNLSGVFKIYLIQDEAFPSFKEWCEKNVRVSYKDITPNDCEFRSGHIYSTADLGRTIDTFCSISIKDENMLLVKLLRRMHEHLHSNMLDYFIFGSW